MFKKHNTKIFFLIIILLLISTNYNFFLNTYKLTKQSYNDRMLSIYGDCSKEGYGFTKYINNKYQSHFNYIVLNGKPHIFATTQDLFYDKNKIFNDQYRILIDFDDELLKDFRNFNIIEKKENCYFIKIINE
jgi:hypothetical protein